MEEIKTIKPTICPKCKVNSTISTTLDYLADFRTCTTCGCRYKVNYKQVIKSIEIINR